MDVFVSTLNQTVYLFILIIIGFLLAKTKVLPASAAGMLGKLENTILIPALVMGTFMQNFTVERLGSTGALFIFSFVLLIPIIPVAIFLPKLLSKDSFTKNIFTISV